MDYKVGRRVLKQIFSLRIVFPVRSENLFTTLEKPKRKWMHDMYLIIGMLYPYWTKTDSPRLSSGKWPLLGRPKLGVIWIRPLYADTFWNFLRLLLYNLKKKKFERRNFGAICEHNISGKPCYVLFSPAPLPTPPPWLVLLGSSWLLGIKILPPLGIRNICSQNCRDKG